MTEHEPMQLARGADPGGSAERRQEILAGGGVLGAAVYPYLAPVPLAQLVP